MDFSYLLKWDDISDTVQVQVPDGQIPDLRLGKEPGLCNLADNEDMRQVSETFIMENWLHHLPPR